MRASSRAACLSARGTRWLKYRCERSPFSYAYYTQSSWYGVGPVSGEVYGGASGYTFNSDTGEFSLSGSKTISSDVSGTVYQLRADGSLARYVSNGNGTITMACCEASGPYEASGYDYSAGEYIATIRSPEGGYPQAEDGYVYAAKFDIYTVMQNAGEYYCYTREER